MQTVCARVCVCLCLFMGACMHARIRMCLCLHPCVCLYVPVSVRMCVSATGTHTDDMRGPVFPTKAYPLSLQLASSSPCSVRTTTSSSFSGISLFSHFSPALFLQPSLTIFFSFVSLEAHLNVTDHGSRNDSSLFYPPVPLNLRPLSGVDHPPPCHGVPLEGRDLGTVHSCALEG